jgi:hypothetical protein
MTFEWAASLVLVWALGYFNGRINGLRWAKKQLDKELGNGRPKI